MSGRIPDILQKKLAVYPANSVSGATLPSTVGYIYVSRLELDIGLQNWRFHAEMNLEFDLWKQLLT